MTVNNLLVHNITGHPIRDRWNLNRLLTLIHLAAAKQNNNKPVARASASVRL